MVDGTKRARRRSGPRFRVEVDVSACKGCGLCLAFCPNGCLAMSQQTNRKGLHFAVFTAGRCTGCRACALICPDTALTIFREDD